jgi:hypothetical protein
MITADGELAIVMKTDDGKLLTCVYETTTILDHVLGTATVAGTAMNELTATV